MGRSEVMEDDVVVGFLAACNRDKTKLRNLMEGANPIQKKMLQTDIDECNALIDAVRAGFTPRQLRERRSNGR